MSRPISRSMLEKRTSTVPERNRISPIKTKSATVTSVGEVAVSKIELEKRPKPRGPIKIKSPTMFRSRNPTNIFAPEKSTASSRPMARHRKTTQLMSRAA